MSIWRWADWLDPVPEKHRVTLGEGNTPLLRSRKIGPAAGLKNLYFKLETTNPAGSFKDRFGAAAVSNMLARGEKRCIATSSGNTGAALAAYTAAAGIECRIAVVETAPQGKLRQMLAYGANIYRIRDFGIDPDLTQRAFEALHATAAAPDAAMQVSSYIYSPLGMNGVKTIAFELAEQAKYPLDRVFCPAGGGGLCVAIARGFGQLVENGRLERGPAVDVVQPEGNDTIAGPLREGAERARPIDCTTKISGLQVANVNDGHLVVEECLATGGTGHLVSDEEVWTAQERLAVEEGIFSEPAGAVALAGALKAAANSEISSDSHVVCLVTGSGFKDEASLDKMITGREVPLVNVDEIG